MISQLTAVIIPFLALLIGGLISLFLTGHIRNFLEMIQANDTINNLRRERNKSNQQLAEVRKRNTLLEKEIAQRDVQITLLKTALEDREKKINDLTDHIRERDELFVEHRKTIRELEKRVEARLSIAFERERAIFQFIKKFIEPDVDYLEVLKMLQLEAPGDIVKEKFADRPPGILADPNKPKKNDK